MFCAISNKSKYSGTCSTQQNHTVAAEYPILAKCCADQNPKLKCSHTVFQRSSRPSLPLRNSANALNWRKTVESPENPRQPTAARQSRRTCHKAQLALETRRLRRGPISSDSGLIASPGLHVELVSSLKKPKFCHCPVIRSGLPEDPQALATTFHLHARAPTNMATQFQTWHARAQVFCHGSGALVVQPVPRVCIGLHSFSSTCEVCNVASCCSPALVQISCIPRDSVSRSDPAWLFPSWVLVLANFFLLNPKP